MQFTYIYIIIHNYVCVDRNMRYSIEYMYYIIIIVS